MTPAELKDKIKQRINKLYNGALLISEEFNSRS
jgi:hypothetical protein